MLQSTCVTRLCPVFPASAWKRRGGIEEARMDQLPLQQRTTSLRSHPLAW